MSEFGPSDSRDDAAKRAMSGPWTFVRSDSSRPPLFQTKDEAMAAVSVSARRNPGVNFYLFQAYSVIHAPEPIVETKTIKRE